MKPYPDEMTETKLNIDSTARPNFFHSPQTPSSAFKGCPTIATSYIERPCVSADSRTYSSSRKRNRNGSWGLETPDSVAPSPLPFANMNYRLAGGLDTPTAVTSQYSTYETTTPGLSFRRGRPYVSYERNDYFHEHGGDNIRGMPGKDGNGRAPQPVHQPTQNTWGSLVFGLAGKMFDFCTAGTFRGFFSGGGQGYQIKSEHAKLQPISPLQRLEDSEWIDFPTASPLDSDLEDSRATKKSKLLHNDTWIVVQNPIRTMAPDKTQPSLILRPSSSASFRNTSPIRQATTASVATVGASSKRPIANLRRTISTRTASSAGLRSPQTSDPLMQAQPGSGNRRNSSFKDNSTLSHKRGLSSALSAISTAQTKIAAPLSAGSAARHYGVQTHEQAESPLAKETRKHIDKVRKKEKAEDLEIMKMERQLKDLIKQGKEALGTKIEVDLAEHDDW